MNILEGWKLVPVEPTPVMTAAYSVAAEELTKRHLLSGSYPATWQPIEAGYAAMLAAAPTPPAATLRLPEPMTGEEIYASDELMRLNGRKLGLSLNELAEVVSTIGAVILRRVKEANA